jgi:7-cyano-7-deazaguanine synthase
VKIAAPFSVQKVSKSPKKAIVLFSGGLDSTTCLYWALSQGYVCETLTVTYGQRHAREIKSAEKIAAKLGVKTHFLDVKLPWLAEGCSLTDATQPLPDLPVEQIVQEGIPSTYVPGRNLLFLSLAGSLADSVDADAIIAGPNAVDFSGYPDCTPDFYKAAAQALNCGTKKGVTAGLEVLAPLMYLSKADIVRLADSLHVPFELTWSCYAGEDKPCGKCDSCKLRARGFEEAGVKDTALK